MDKQEFFLLIPAIIYGVAIIDLLKIFSHKNNYFEMVGWGIYVMLGVIFNWIDLFGKLDSIANGKIVFFMIITQAILFAKIASLITPEEKDVDTKAYFFQVCKLLFWLLSAVAMYGIIMRRLVFDDHSFAWIHPLLIVFYLTAAYSNKTWVRLIVLASILTLAGLRIFAGAFV